MAEKNNRPDNWLVQFPVSLAVEGPDCYDRMADEGVRSAIFCTTIYAPYRLVLPRYPQKGIYSLEEGLYYFRPEESRYRDLPVAPASSRDFSDRDMLAEMVSAAHQAGLEAAAWVTIFASGRTARNHPDWAVKNLYGSADRLFLDVDHPEVVEYSLRILEEIVSRYAVDEIMLDKIPQTCLELNAFAGRIDPVLRVLGSFCFSEHAAEAAWTHGIDLKVCRKEALNLAEQCLAVPPHVVNALASELQGDMEAPLLLLDHPWIVDVLKFRIASVNAFIRQARERIDRIRKGVKLTACFVPPVKVGHDASSPRSWLAAQSYAGYKDAPLDAIHCVVHWPADVVEYDTRRAVNAVGPDGPDIATHVKAYGGTRPDELPALAAAARRAGAVGVGYFCYDLMTDAMLDTMGEVEKARHDHKHA